MPEHVRVDRHAELGLLAGTCDQLAESGRRHRRAAFGNEDIRRVGIIAQQLAQCPEFRPMQWVRAWQPVLAAAHMQ